MILTVEQLKADNALVIENAEIIQRFEESGSDVARVEIVSYMCDFPSFESAQSCLDMFSRIIREPKNRLPTMVSMDITDVSEEDEDLRPFLANCSLRMALSVERVWQIESIFHLISREFDGGDVSWEYLRPEPMQEAVS
ncbi:MAG: hypothetical protein AAGD04_14900 [Pseudomonadota bacterium]